MTYYLLGTGGMAHLLASLLSGTDWHCAGVWGRDANRATVLANALSAPVMGDLAALTLPVDLILVALADDAIATVVSKLPETTATLIHFSGTVPIAALQPHPHRAVCWPVYSIRDGQIPQPSIPAFGESSNPAARQALQSLTKALSWVLYEGPESTRRQLHLAAVIGNNFITHLLCICEQLCAEHDLPAAVLQPLLYQTFERAGSGNPCEAQTGPARRGDRATQDAHLALLTAHPHWQQLYTAISNSIAEMYPPQ
ncbi:MAG: DUF2520 domain-containing protein [Sphingobacteriales bacterium]|nr:MAG: DUF2520 domain-containing protein [Sphingobacteriales bacterium]